MQADPDAAVAEAATLVGVARDLLSHSDQSTAGIWPLTVALLTRQALELTLDAFWLPQAPEVAGCSMRAQLLCLQHYADEETAETASDLWGSLSGACHHHPYDLSPTAGELLAWIEGVEDVWSTLSGQTRSHSKIL